MNITFFILTGIISSHIVKYQELSFLIINKISIGIRSCCLKICSPIRRNKEMINIEILLDQIKYGEIADTLIPIVIDKLSEREDSGRLIQILNGLDKLPGSIAKTALNSLPESVKEEIAVYFLERYKNNIIEFINAFAEENKIEAKVGGIRISREKV